LASCHCLEFVMQNSVSPCVFGQDPNGEVIAAMEQSYHRQLVELQRSHKQQLEELRHEKDELLKDETKATQAGENRYLLQVTQEVTATSYL